MLPVDSTTPTHSPYLAMSRLAVMFASDVVFGYWENSSIIPFSFSAQRTQFFFAMSTATYSTIYFSPPFSLCLCCWWSSWKPQSSIRARSSLRQQRHWEGEASFTHAQDFRLSEMLRGQQATTHTNPSSWCGGFYMSIRTLLDVVLQARAMPLPLLTSPCISTQNEELSVISLYALAGSD